MSINFGPPNLEDIYTAMKEVMMASERVGEEAAEEFFPAQPPIQ